MKKMQLVYSRLQKLRILSLSYLAQAAILISKTHKFRALSLPAGYQVANSVKQPVMFSSNHSVF